MSDSHGPVVLKSIEEIAEFKRNLVPVNIPEDYLLKTRFTDVASEGYIRNGIVAFRDFLYLFFDRLISDGNVYMKPPKKPANMTDYPFLHNVTNLLVDIGYYGSPDENNGLLVRELPTCSDSVDDNGKKTKAKISASGQIECLRFLTLCGFVFPGVDLDSKSFSLTDAGVLEVTYPDDPLMLFGLKAMSIADMELRMERRYWNDNTLLRCDYRLLKEGDTDMIDALKDLVQSLPESLQEFAFDLHQRYTGMGMTCAMNIRSEVSFAYAFVSKNKKVFSTQDIYSIRVWALTYSLRHGFSLFVRAKKTEKYADLIETFPPVLQDTIKQGYGCDRKLRNERCQGGCQGIRLPFDESIVDIRKDIEAWLDNEVSFSRKK